MSDFSKKSSFAQNLANAVRYLNDSDNEGFGWQLPCTVAEVDKTKGIVTVNFSVIGADGNPLDLPQITIPISGWKYIRYPIQVGDAGLTVSIDTNTQNISKLTPGITSLISHGNFGPTLFFVPIAQADWVESDDPDAVVIYGPNGVIIRDEEGNTIVKVSATGMVTVDGNVFVKGNLSTTQNVVAGTGANGTFTTVDGSTVTVQAGIITNIV